MAHTFIINILLLAVSLRLFVCFLFPASLFCTVFVSFFVPASLKPPSPFLFLPCHQVCQTIDVLMQLLYKWSLFTLKTGPHRLLVYIDSWLKAVMSNWVNEFSALKFLVRTISSVWPSYFVNQFQTSSTGPLTADPSFDFFPGFIHYRSKVWCQ